MNALSRGAQERLLLLSISSMSAWGAIAFADILPRTISFLVMLIALNISMGCILYPRKDGYFLPSIQNKWQNFSRPAAIGLFDNKPVLERWDLLDFRSIYDGKGRLIATEQEIDWSSTDLDWRPGDQGHIQMIVTQYDGSERLSWLARWRSPRLPVGKQAEIMASASDDRVIGLTPYKVN